MSTDVVIIPEVEGEIHRFPVAFTEQRPDVSYKAGRTILSCHECTPSRFFHFFGRVSLLSVPLTCSRQRRSPDVFIVWNMRFAHVPHNKYIFCAAKLREHPARESEDS